MTTQTDERERHNFHWRLPMSKQEKLEEIRRMRSELRGEATKESNERE
jgi:hypothetical protein